MRVLQLIDSLNVGGAERLAVTYANALTSSIEASFLCTTRQEGKLRSQLKTEVGYIHAARTKVIDKKAVGKVEKYIKQHKIDCIHAHGTSFLFAFLIKKKMPSLKVIWHIHSGNLPNTSRIKKLIMRYCMPSIDTVICVNNELKEWVQSKFKKQKVVYLRNFVSFDRNTKEKKVHKLVSDQKYRVVCLANLRKPKDHHTLVNAFVQVIEKVPLASLYLIGQDFEEEYSITLKSLIKEKGLGQSVNILGLQTNPEAYLKQCRVGVLSSTSEGLPMSLLEYGRAGLIPVVTDVGQCAEVVGDTGYIVPFSSADALSKAIVLALKTTANTGFQEKIKKEYSQEAVISSLLEVYNVAIN